MLRVRPLFCNQIKKITMFLIKEGMSRTSAVLAATLFQKVNGRPFNQVRATHNLAFRQPSSTLLLFSQFARIAHAKVWRIPTCLN